MANNNEMVDKLQNFFNENLTTAIGQRRILGLPYNYTERVDPSKRTFEESIVSDLPIVHITPGIYKYKNGVRRVIEKVFNAVDFPLLPIGVDGRVIKFKAKYIEYYRYLTTMSGLLYQRMMGTLNSNDINFPTFNLYDTLKYDEKRIKNIITDTLAGGEETDDFKKDLFSISSEDDEDEAFKKFMKDPAGAFDELEEQSKQALNLAADESGLSRINDLKTEIEDLKGSGNLSESEKQILAGKEDELEELKAKKIPKIPDVNTNDLFSSTNMRGYSEMQKLGINASKENGTVVESANLSTLYMERKRLETQGLTFFMTAGSSVSETFSNSFGASNMASKMKEAASKKQEAKATSGTGSIGGKMIAAVSSMKEFVGGMLSGASTANMMAITNGNMISFPDIWKDSSVHKSYRVSFRFASPYGDPFSIFMNVFFPLMSIACLQFPRYSSSDGYMSPYILKIDAPGNFASDFAVISNMTVKRGGDSNSWNAYGLPLVVDVSLTFKDLFHDLVMGKSSTEVNANGTTAVYLSNLAGIPMDPINPLGRDFNSRVNRFRQAIGNLKNVNATKGVVKDSFASFFGETLSGFTN